MANTNVLAQRIALWNQQHPNQKIDPAAEFAVARQEGLSGGIGDNGHAFGPNQLNNAGGVLTGKFTNLDPQAINRWAWSPAGIDYALGGIARAAGGLQGADAVRAIVSRFERPANPGRETANALAALGGSGPTPPPVTPPYGQPLQPTRQAMPVPVAPRQNPNIAAALKLLGFADAPVPPPRQAGPTLMAPTRTSGAAQTAPTRPTPTLPTPSTAPRMAPVPTDFSTRAGIQLDPTILSAAEQVARRFGVKINSGYRSAEQNAAVGGAPQSDHLSGDAVDFTGSPTQQAALYAWAQHQGFPYVEPMAQSRNHVHISFRR